MNRKFWGTLAGLGLALPFIGWLAWSVLGWLPGVETGARGTLAAATATALVSVFTLSLTRRLEADERNREALRTRKAEIYDKFVRGLFTQNATEQSGQVVSLQEKAKFGLASITDLTIWAAADVVKRFGEFKEDPQARAKGAGSRERLESLLRAIRADLGHDDSNLPDGGILAMLGAKEDEGNGSGRE